MSFQTKLLLAMMLLVAGVTSATLLITENQVRASYGRHFQQSFGFQVQSFLRQRQERLAPIKTRLAEAGASVRLIAAMENALQAGAAQQEIDDLYQNGIDQLMEILGTYQPVSASPKPGFFFFFLSSKGQVLSPSPDLKLPFVLPGLRRISPQIELISQAVSRVDEQQTGYLAPRFEPGGIDIREMLFTPVVDQVTRRQLGVLAVGFPLHELALALPEWNGKPNDELSLESVGERSGTTILSGIWLEDQLYSSSVPPEAARELEKDIGRDLKAGRQIQNNTSVRVGTVPHQLFCQTLNMGRAFPPAYQVCLYSLAEAEAEKARFRQKILLSGTVALLGALGLGLLISRGLAGPIQALLRGTTQIEHGNYRVKVPVRGDGEIGRLAQAFNEMTERLQASHLAQEQRMAERTQELTERKRAEEALRQSEASLREAQRIAHLGNWRWDLVTNQLRWSDEIYGIFGLASGQFQVTYETFLKRVHPQDREKIREAVRQTLEAGKPYNLEHRIMRPDGETRVVHERAEVIRNNAGLAVQMVGTVQDITEQKRIEAEFLRAQRLDSIGSLAGGMAHDLNNALAPILMGLQLMRRQLRDPETQQMLAVMEANTHRGADLVRQVLMFARGRDGERELQDLGRLLQEMENIMRQTLPKSINVTTMVPADLWPVLGNPTQLHQVLLNLCINARDAMPDGGELTLAADNIALSPAEAKEIPQGRPGSFVLLFVSDTGTGIAPEVLPRLFQPFFTTKPPGQGTGLGLSTIARIVRNHGAFVNVKSELGAGTTFEIYFPRPEVVPQAEPVAPGASAGPRIGQGELILFIDDDRSVREMVTPTLIEHGYRVLSAANGAEALALLAQHEREVSLVLTDLAMPVMDGAATLAALRVRCPELPVILMSGELESAAQPQAQGIAGFLAKPFQVDQLLAAIAHILDVTDERD